MMCFFGGLVAYIIARMCGVPAWTWDTSGDAVDLGIAVMAFIYYLDERIKQK